MENLHLKRCFVRVLVISLLLLECNSLKLDYESFTKSQDRLNSESAGEIQRTGEPQKSRQSKQFLLPFVVWQYHHPLGIYMVPQQYPTYHYQHVMQSHQSAQLQPQPQQQSISNRRDEDNIVKDNQLSSLPHDMYLYHRRDVPAVVTVHSAAATSFRQEEEKVVVVAAPIESPRNQSASTAASRPQRIKVAATCKTANMLVGECKKFQECFPMMELEYGSDEEHVNYKSSPLVEQLMQNVNSTVCLQQGGGSNEYEETDEILNEICCPLKDFKGVEFRVERFERNGVGSHHKDRHVNLPSVTQRPPVRSVVSRELIKNQMCGQSASLRPVKSYGKVSLGGGIAIPKITGGVEATGPKEFPWMVAVFGKNQRIFCGASLITDRFLLSAAHCFSTFSPSDIKNIYVHLGDFNLRTTFDGPHEVRKVEKIIVHKGFKIQTYANDIALLKLDRPVNFTERIMPICLPEATMKSMDKETVIVTGWGRKFRYGVTSDTLRKVEMPMWEHKECKRVYDVFAPGRLLDTNICAGDGKRNKDACLGDSGGPAIYYDGKKWVQIGITSWGKGCGNYPGVYTRVDKYLMWLTKNLEQFK